MNDDFKDFLNALSLWIKTKPAADAVPLGWPIWDIPQAISENDQAGLDAQRALDDYIESRIEALLIDRSR